MAQMWSVVPVLATGYTVMTDIHCGILAVQVAGGTDVAGVHGGMLLYR